jgi:hypothetical protein|tara:strand:+ start:646 stop:849 length:204 start_codon:yes stop_codon:yes gene_type:complete
MDIHMQNTILLKQNVAVARNYMVLPWYLDEFKDLELSQNKSRKDPNTLNLILKQARRRLNIKIQEII